jgi:hypothetical protein
MGDEVLHPPVVGLDARVPVLVVVGLRRRRELRTRRLVSRRSFQGFLYFSRHASKSGTNLGSRNSRYVSWFAPAWVSAEMIV